MIFRKPPGPACVQFILSKFGRLEGSWETGASNDKFWAQDDEGVIERIKKSSSNYLLIYFLDTIKFRVIIIFIIIVFRRQLKQKGPFFSFFYYKSYL